MAEMKNLLSTLSTKWKNLNSYPGFRRAPARAITRLAVWQAISLMRRPATIHFPRWEMRMFVPPGWRTMGRPLYAFREYYELELANLDRFLVPGMVFVDVGACYGCYALAASKIVGKTGRVVAFEPALRAFQVLQDNVRMNGLENVHVERVALGQVAGKARLYHHPDFTRNSLGEQPIPAQDYEEVETRSLDQVLQQISIERVDMIKMDAEGSEELVLRGATSILGATHPTIIFEVNPGAARRLGLSPDGAWQLLDRMGYGFYLLDDGDNLSRIESSPGEGNVLAIYNHQV